MAHTPQMVQSTSQSTGQSHIVPQTGPFFSWPFFLRCNFTDANSAINLPVITFFWQWSLFGHESGNILIFCPAQHHFQGKIVRLTAIHSGNPSCTHHNSTFNRHRSWQGSNQVILNCPQLTGIIVVESGSKSLWNLAFGIKPLRTSPAHQPSPILAYVRNWSSEAKFINKIFLDFELWHTHSGLTLLSDNIMAYCKCEVQFDLGKTG